MNEAVFRFLKMNDVEYKENVSLRSLSTIRIGGIAKTVVYPDNADKLIKVITMLKHQQIKHKIVGRMSNILPCDDIFAGVVVKTDLINDFTFCENSLSVGCGISLPRLAVLAERIGLSGIEELSGIPGSLAGAILGNAGAFGREISHVVKEVEYFSLPEMRLMRLKVSECNFDYRRSIFQELDGVIISAKLNLTNSSVDLIKSRRIECKNRRFLSQPVEFPSLGSTFKRVSKSLSASKLIDLSGLKGFGIGGAQVSEKHAGFIVNIHGATAEDYIKLADYVSMVVYDKYQVKLEKEIEIL